MKDWRKAIVDMYKVKQELMACDKKKILSYHLPEVAASEEILIEAEEQLGFKLDNGYRDFLTFANGWKGFYQTVDLFGTKELKDLSLVECAKELIDVINKEGVIVSSGFKVEELYPIAATKFDKDIFVITKPDSSNPGIIIWFAGEEIDRFQSFEEFFYSMIEYNKKTLEYLKKMNNI